MQFEESFLVLKPSKMLPLRIFIGKGRICRMNEMSAACVSSDFDGNTILVGSDDFGYNQSLSTRGDNEFIFISGFEIIEISTEDEILYFISLMGKNMIPTAIAIGGKFTYFRSDHYKFFENNNIEEGILLNSTNDSLDPFDYHLAKCDEGAFKTMECNQIQFLPE